MSLKFGKAMINSADVNLKELNLKAKEEGVEVSQSV